MRYLDKLPERRVGPAPDAVRRLSAWDTPLPEGPTDPQETLRVLDEFGSPATMGMAGGRFFGFAIGGALPVTVATNWLATAWDQNTGLHTIAPATSDLERIALGWLVDLFGLPPGAGGGYVTGATVANFTARCALAAGGGTVWQGHTAMRISVCSWATTDEDVEKSLEAMLRIALRERAKA